MNANPAVAQLFQLPKGEWEVLVDPSKAGTTPIKIVKNIIEVEPTSGFVLKKK